MDVCAFCGEVYHPMMVWSKPFKTIHVCSFHPRIDEEGAYQQDPSTCPAKAEAEGYTRRPDLTPKR